MLMNRARGLGETVDLGLPFFSLYNVKVLSRFCKRRGVQVIHAHSSKAHTMGLLIKLLNPDIKLVVHRRVDFVPGTSWMTRRKYLSPKVDEFVAISRTIREVLVSYGVPSSKIALVPSATDPQIIPRPLEPSERAGRRAALGLTEAWPVILQAAYFTAQKDHATMIKALAILKNQGLKFYCLFAGEGELMAECERMVDQARLGMHVKFLGIRDDVADLLLLADIFTLSSRYEGLGTSILDAMLAGVCVAATDAGGIGEIVQSGTTGLLSPTQNPEALAENLAKLIRDEALRGKFAQAGREDVLARFPLSGMIEGNLAVYKSLLTS
jgi:glycosyltransferase involved in cell wall biosynthesis